MSTILPLLSTVRQRVPAVPSDGIRCQVLHLHFCVGR